MTTFTFESRYRDGGGGRCDVVVAPDRETAIRAAAMAIIVDNDWLDGRAQEYQSLESFFKGEMEILSEWKDLKGAACPNCTSHGGKWNGDIHAWTTGQAKVFECEACDYQWVPLGRKAEPAQQSPEDLKAELDAFEREHMNPEEADDEEV